MKKARKRPSLSRAGVTLLCCTEIGRVMRLGPDPRWHLTAALACPPIAAMTFGRMRDEPPRPSDHDFADDEECTQYNCEKEQRPVASVRGTYAHSRAVASSGKPDRREAWKNEKLVYPGRTAVGAVSVYVYRPEKGAQVVGGIRIFDTGKRSSAARRQGTHARPGERVAEARLYRGPRLGQPRRPTLDLLLPSAEAASMA